MAEDQDKQDDEKLDFDSAGQALGYISLDQARVLALQHARDYREIYGRYADRELVWDVVSAEETEDYYEIRLSYRPAGNFRAAGIEQFTIDKTGPIEFRQILSQPVERKRLALFMGAAGLLAVAGVVIGVLFSVGGESSGLTEAPARPESIIEQGGESSGITAPARGAWFYPITADSPLQWSPLNGDVTIALDAGSVDRVVGLEFELVSEIPTLPAGFVSLGKQFDLSVQPDHDSASIPYTFLKPIIITFRLSGTDATLVRGDESNVVIQHFLDAEAQWEPLATSVDFGASTATTQVDHLSIFVLTIREPEPTPTPVPTLTATTIPALTDTPEPTSTPVPKSVQTGVSVETTLSQGKMVFMSNRDGHFQI